jgi:hypothetical protein
MTTIFSFLRKGITNSQYGTFPLAHSLNSHSCNKNQRVTTTVLGRFFSNQNTPTQPPLLFTGKGSFYLKKVPSQSNTKVELNIPPDEYSKLLKLDPSLSFVGYIKTKCMTEKRFRYLPEYLGLNITDEKQLIFEYNIYCKLEYNRYIYLNYSEYCKVIGE